MIHDADRIQGDEFAYLGHFNDRDILARGHNTTVAEPPGLMGLEQSVLGMGSGSSAAPHIPQSGAGGGHGGGGRMGSGAQDHSGARDPVSKMIEKLSDPSSSLFGSGDGGNGGDFGGGGEIGGGDSFGSDDDTGGSFGGGGEF